MNSSSAIVVNNVSFEYPGVKALSDVSFRIEPASVTALVGPNGAGKSTLLRCIAGLDRPLLAAWGSKMAADGIGDEARNRTWDAQRLTSIGPWQMTCGKLAGASAFAWYGGGLCLLVFIVAGVGQLPMPVLRLAGLIVAGSVLCQAVAFTGSLMAAQRNQATRSTNALVWMFVLLSVASSARRWLAVDQGTVAWWGASHANVNFVLVSAIVFAAWAVLGAYRSMCSALHVPTTLWVLVVFLCFASVYLAGFASLSNGSVAGLVAVMGVGVSLAACYGLLFMEQTGAMTLRRLQMRISRRQWLEAQQELPGWPVALLLALLFAIGTRFASIRDGGTWAIVSLLRASRAGWSPRRCFTLPCCTACCRGCSRHLARTHWPACCCRSASSIPARTPPPRPCRQSLP